MILDGVNYPNQLVDAIKNGKLVVFAGAGASMSAPTCLPDFRGLVRKLSEGTKYEFNEKEDSCEVFLGRLEAKQIDVHKKTKELMEGSCKEPNDLHRAIYNLFINSDSIKIVTTNYDQMFEAVDYNNLEVFNAPALPYGDDVNGIVHLHGNIKHPQYMVLTDEDFGRAYITDGYASRFLKKLFSTYTVLFIGYSYNDIILQYLTRAMFRENTQESYIITDKSDKDYWNVLGLTPIVYPLGQHDSMRKSLSKLGERAKRGLVEWKDLLSEINEMPPREMSFMSEIEYCLENYERARVLASCVRGKEWLDYFESKGVFKECFLKNEKDEKILSIWSRWLCDNFIGVDDTSLQLLIANHNNTLNEKFSEAVVNKIISDKNITDDVFVQYTLLIEPYLENIWLLTRLIEESHQRGLNHLCFELFKSLLDVRFIFQKKMLFSDNGVEYKHSFATESYRLKYVWDKIKDKMLSEFSYELVLFVKDVIEKVHFYYCDLKEASDENEPFSFLMIDIENKDKYSKDNSFVILNRIYGEAINAVCIKDKLIFKHILNQCLKSKSNLMQRMALRVLRKSDVYNSKEKYCILLECFSLYSVDKKEQIFLLTASFWKDLDISEKEYFINKLLDVKDEVYDYEKYNWIVWLNKCDKDNKRLNLLKKSYEEKYNFKPRECPELNIFSSEVTIHSVKTPVDTDEMKNMNVNHLIADLINEKKFPVKFGLLNTLYNCVKDDFGWTEKIINNLVSKKINDNEIWNYLINGICDSNYKIEELCNVVGIFNDNIDIIPNKNALARMVFKMIQRNEYEKYSSQYEELILNFTKKIWSARSLIENKSFDDDICLRTINSAQGNILDSWIHMVSYHKEKQIPDQYKELFSDALLLEGNELDISICILAGYYNFFWMRDQKWSEEYLLPFLTSHDKQKFNDAWSGLVYFSGTIYRDTADYMSNVYLQAIKKIKWLTEDTKNRMIEQIVTLIIHIVENPICDFIPELYEASEETDIVYFIKALNRRLHSMDAEEKVILWEKWLRIFLQNRKRNIPTILTEKENQELCMIIVNLKEVFSEAVDIICTGNAPSKIEWSFWNELNKDEFISINEESIAKILLFLLSREFDVEYSSEDIKELTCNLKDISQEKKKEIREVLLKHNISLEF
ncbi:MAG: DUF4020 domain-containing protein [Lachnospiraceae bacterium]|nr:DUF4020 domain-containing protein [Lachnospiraceae bacterium]